MNITKSVKSLICLMLALVMGMTSTGLTACNKTSESSDWKATEAESVSLGIDVAKSEGHYTVTLTHDSDVFVDKVSAENIKIEGIYLNETDASQESTEPIYTSDTITAFQVERESAKKLVITFDATTDYTLMIVAVHKSAMSNKKFGDAYWREGFEVYLPPSVSIVGEFTVYDQNPTLNIVLENTTFSDNLTADMVVLDGAFRGITVTDVTGNEQNVTVTTTGMINDKTVHGKVTLKAEATRCGSPLDAFTTVKPVGAAVIPESYRLVDGNLEFRVEFGNIALTADKAVLAEAITAEELDINVKEIGTDYAVLTIATDAATVDEALGTIGRVSFSIAGSALSTDKDAVLFISATTAELRFTVDYVSLENDKYRAEGTFYALYGNMEELSAADLTFGGDFAGATVESLDKRTSSYSLVFTFPPPYEGFDLETCELNGTLTVEEGKIKNLWGTNGNNACSYTYVYDDMDKDLGDFVAAIGNFASVADTTKLSTIGRVASGIGGVANVANGVFTILQMTGVIQDSTDRKLEEIKQAVEAVSKKIDNLSDKIDSLGKQVGGSIGKISNKIDENTHIAVCGFWRDYMGTYVGRLQTVLSDYEENYRANVVRFLNDPADTEIMIYVDSKGNITIPGVSNKRSPDGDVIDKIYIYTGNAEEVSALVEEMIKGGTLEDNYRTLKNGYDEALEEGFQSRNLLSVKSIVRINDASKTVPDTKPTPSQLYYGLTLSFAKDALDKVGIQNVLNAYTAFCYRLGGGGDTSPDGLKAARNYIDDFYTMMTLYYNFYSEAENDIKLMRAYLQSLSIKARGLAAFAQEYTTQTTIVSDATAAINKTLAKKVMGEDVELVCPFDWEDMLRAHPVWNSAFSFVTGKRIWTHVHTAYYKWLYTASPSELISEDEIRLIYHRYKKLKDAGITKANDFFEYLCGKRANTILSYTDGNRRIALTSKRGFFSTDDRLSLYATNLKKKEYPGANYFKDGQLNTLDCSGKREKQYYSYLERADTTFITLNGEVETVLSSASGFYIEKHGYWKNDEIWQFDRNFIGESGIYLLCY